jgi:hypothetical protein
MDQKEIWEKRKKKANIQKDSGSKKKCLFYNGKRIVRVISAIMMMLGVMATWRLEFVQA